MKYIYVYALYTAIAIVSLLSCEIDENKKQTSKEDIARQKPPNIIIFLTDDMGYTDISCYGGEIPTPNIDRLAYNGLRFKNFYTNGICSPTRASLLTGLYPHKVGVGLLSNPKNETQFPGYKGYLNLNYKILPELLKEAGYYNILCGKWDLGGIGPSAQEKSKWPIQRGFDYFFGILDGAPTSNFAHSQSDFYLNNLPYKTDKFKTDYGEDFYSSKALTTVALRQIDKVYDKNPFFLYLPYLTPHHPRQAPEEIVKKYEKKYHDQIDIFFSSRHENLQKEGLAGLKWKYNSYFFEKVYEQKIREKDPEFIRDLATYAAMVELIDKSVGRIINNLDSLKLLDNTLIFFLSDNGSTLYINNFPYASRKGQILQGGLNTHGIIHYPNKIKRAQIINNAAHVIDVMPTILSVTNLEYPNTSYTLPGIDLSKYFNKSLEELNIISKRPYLFWEIGGSECVLKEERWKWGKRRGVFGSFLYDLEKDGFETKNLIDSFPERIESMRKAYSIYAKDNNVMPVEIVNKYRKRNNNGKN